MKLWFSLFSGILLQFRFPQKEPRHKAIRPCLGISLLLKSDPREDVNILLRGWVPPQSRTNVKLTLMFPSWKAVEQMVADTFFRNPGNPPVYPLRYEKKKKGWWGGYPKMWWREKMTGVGWAQEKTMLHGVMEEAHPPPTARSWVAGQGTGFLQGGTWGNQEAENTWPSLSTGDTPSPEHSKDELE